MHGTHIDYDAFRRDLDSLLARVETAIADEGYEDTLRRIGQDFSRSIELNFRNRGRPEKWQPLAPWTIKLRQFRAAEGGVKPVAGYDTPLRVSDSLRKAATADREGVSGSAYRVTKDTLVIGVDESKGSPVRYALRATGVKQPTGGKIPVRNPVILQDGDKRQAEQELEAEVHRRLKRL